MEQYMQQIETVIANIGGDPQHCRITSSKGTAWVLKTEQLSEFLVLDEVEGDPILRLTCPLLFMPPEDLLPFYRMLLDINDDIPSASFTLDLDVVCLVAKQSLEGISDDCIQRLVERMYKLASMTGNALLQEFPNARIWHVM